MNKHTTLLTCALVSLCLVSCNDEPNSPAPLNFEIVSSETFEILETYENGWIKEAVQYDPAKQPLLEFSYHQNGYLKSYRLYRPALAGSLYLDHERDEADLPLRSTYYDLEGNVYAELLCENGSLSTKVIYYKNTQTTFLFEHGLLQRVEKEDNGTGQKTVVTYDHSNWKRILQIDIPGSPGYNVETSMDGTLGAGYNAIDDLTLLNIMAGDNDFSATTVNTASSLSLGRKTSVNIHDVCVAPVEYYDLEDDFITKFGSLSDARSIKGLMNSDFNRSLLEQYPFAEEVVFVGRSSSVDKQYTLKAGLSGVIANTNALKTQYPGDFELLYGDGYVGKYFTGKNLLVIGTIRNLPSDQSLREQVIEAAEKRAGDLLSGRETLTETERELLSHVFFQLKAHADVLGTEGRRISSHADYQEVVDRVTAADPAIVHVVVSRHF